MIVNNPVLYVIGNNSDVVKLAEEIGWTVLSCEVLPELRPNLRTPIALAMLNAADCVYVLPQLEKEFTTEINFADSQQKMFLYNESDLHWFYMILAKEKNIQLSMSDMRRKEYA